MPSINLQELRGKIGQRAKSAPSHRFWGMHVHIVKRETLEASYLLAKAKAGAPGSDGETFDVIEARGRDQFLTELESELRVGTYTPRPCRRREIPKENGKVRVISIACIRDRVVQGAIRLILEPIFEADFSDSVMGARPGRSAHGALDRVREALLRRRHWVADVDLASYFDTIRHAPLLSKLARRISDGHVMALVKQFLRSTGTRGIPQGSPLSPLLANIALNDLDQALDRGRNFITYVRYLDDMVVLAPKSSTGRRWAARALERIREEAAAIGVAVNEEKTRLVTMTDAKSHFAFLGFEFWWVQSLKSGKWFPYTRPRPKKVRAVLRAVRETLRANRHLAVQDAVQRVNPIVRGWANYFRRGNSARALGSVKFHVERKVRRFAAKQRGRRGFGWKRWSSDVVYNQWGLFGDYHVLVAPIVRESAHRPSGTITSLDDAHG